MNFEKFTGGLSHTSENDRSLTNQSGLKILAAFVIPSQERKSFDLVLLKHLSADFKIELSPLQWIWLY